MGDDMVIDSEELSELQSQNRELKAENAALEKRLAELEKALNKIHSWLVCAGITTAEDMAQSFEDMEMTAYKALNSEESKDAK